MCRSGPLGRASSSAGPGGRSPLPVVIPVRGSGAGLPGTRCLACRCCRSSLPVTVGDCLPGDSVQV
ncbi:hypothetical protein F750_3843 [Streptomyces sp. PAMC 26508]|nr:hypothetical protein F750_3843 [Streptomyces sp. PAMC 26508]